MKAAEANEILGRRPGRDRRRLAEASLARVDAMLAARNAASPALALAEHIGLGPQATFRFHTWLAGGGPNASNVPIFQGTVLIDSQKAEWLECSIKESGTGRETSFTATTLEVDTLGLGRCEAEELPRWLAAAGKALNVAWAPMFEPDSSVRGEKRERIVAWLFGGQR